MRVPVSWLKDFVEFDISIEELAKVLTASGLEVDEIHYAGWQVPAENKYGFKITGIGWDPETIVVAEITEVGEHPNADRLTLCELFDGKEHHTVLTGAPNLYPFKGTGKLAKPLKVAYAKEGAVIYDGHADELVLTKLKRAKIRGIDSYSMVCSEKELGISGEHEGVIFLDEDAPVGMPLADYIGDAVLDISILPNNARNANIYGIAREVSALLNVPLKKVEYKTDTNGSAFKSKVAINITDPSLNPRFTLGLIQNVNIKPSPYWVQRRLRMAGMRPISNVVDATNYTMLEIGAPLHAFDYDVLAKRAGDKPVQIITRAAAKGEKLTTLDNLERTLTPENVLVCDAFSALSMAGIMGGLESEIYQHSPEVEDSSGRETTSNILLEAASWNFINIRKTANAHNLHSEAAFRFSRGVHPRVSLDSLKRCLYWMQQWSGGSVSPDIIDEYPAPVIDPVVTITEGDVKRWLGIDLKANEIADLLSRLEFTCVVTGVSIAVKTPHFRTDIGEGIVGIADLMEEVARLYGIDRIPESRMADPLPPPNGNLSVQNEDFVRDVLAELGLQEVITHRMTSPEAENKLVCSGPTLSDADYVRLANPITPEKRVMRGSLISSVLTVVERNNKLTDSLSMFEIGPVFIPQGNDLPLEPRRLAIAITGKRFGDAWDTKHPAKLDFYDLKGVLEGLFEKLHMVVNYTRADHSPYHPGKCVSILAGEMVIGSMGELHPVAFERYDFTSPIIAAELDLERILDLMQTRFDVTPVSDFPPVLEDIAVIVEESLPAEQVEALIRQTGGKLLASVKLFDVFRSEQVGEGKKSLAYAMVYQKMDGTLTDKEATQIRTKIIQRLERELGAKLRS